MERDIGKERREGEGSLPQMWNPEREKFHDIGQTSKISIKERPEARSTRRSWIVACSGRSNLRAAFIKGNNPTIDLA